MRQRRALTGGDSEGSVWPAYTDLMSTVAIILFVLVLLAYLQNLMSSKKLDQARSELDLAAKQLLVSQRQITESEQKLKLLDADLRRTTGEIEAGQARLAAAEDEVKRQQTVIDESHRELGNVRSRLQGIAVLRIDVLERVKRSIEAEMGESGKGPGRTPPVVIADNGNIVISEKLVFEYDSHAIKSSGKPLLDMLSRAFAKVLDDERVRENIDVVLVQGHTDNRGSTAYNRELSAKRANAVLDYMFQTSKPLERSYGSFFAASAYSEFRPLSKSKTEAAHEQNRRIEISVVLKDATIRNTIDEYMKTVKTPAAAPAPAAP